MDTHRRIFLSAASAEFKPLRGKLDAILRRSGFECEFQEIFPTTDSDTVRKLGDLIKNCGLVLHIAGHKPGSIADAEAVRDLLANIPADQFLPKHPELRAALGDFSGITYTQWEAFLALHYGIPLFVYAPADAFAAGKPLATFTQKDHLARLLIARKYAEPCDGDVEFLSKLPSDVYRHFGIQPSGAKPHSLPYPTLGTLFKGRDDFLASLKKQLTTAHTTVIRGKQAIHGMGGIGKTRAAVEYAWQHQHDYTALLFINADSPEALTRNLAALTGPLVLNLPEHAATDTSVQVRAVLAWLQQHPGWFLIIDNVDTPEAQNAVTDLLAQLPDGHIVITSRLADWAAGVPSLALDVLSEKSSIEFLHERTADRRILRDDDLATAKTIAQNLDYLALALEQSAAYIRARRCSFGDYLRDWETKRPHVMATHDPAKSHYPKSIAITFDTSIALLTEDARQLFRILAWLAPEPMPMVHLEKLNIASATVPQPDAQRRRDFQSRSSDVNLAESEPHSEPSSPQARLKISPTLAAPDSTRDLLIQLADLHLATLSADGESFAIHRLLQEVARQQQPEQKPQALLVALQWINGEMPTQTFDVSTWPVAIPLVPHAVQSATFAADRGIPEPTARLLNQAAVLVETQANYRASEPLKRRALALMEKAHGKTHASVAPYINNLASLLHATNRLAEAEPLMRRALAIDEASFGHHHPNVAIRLNNLAQLLQATNRLAEAEPLMRRSFAINEASFGNHHPKVARDLNNLAQLLKATNRLAEAEPLMRRALAIDEASFDNDHPYVAIDLNNLALLLQDTNRLAEAEPLMRRALAIDQASFGNDHPNVAIGLNNLAHLLKATNRLAEAEEQMKRVIAIFEKALGEQHPNVAVALNNLAQLLQATNRRAEAEPLLRRALAIDQASFGNDHPSVAIGLNNLALLLKATNRLGEAEPLMKDAVRILENSLGSGHPRTVLVKGNLQRLQDAMRNAENP